jgi:hypothetical protein
MGMMPCPSCLRAIGPSARVCPYCGYDLVRQKKPEHRYRVGVRIPDEPETERSRPAAGSLGWLVRTAGTSLEGSVSIVEAVISKMRRRVARPPSGMRDRLSAAFAHWLIIVAVISFAIVLTWLPTTILWVREIRRSCWTAFQALQAAVYQCFVSVVTTPFFRWRDTGEMLQPTYYRTLAAVAAVSMGIAISVGVLGVVYGIVAGLTLLTGRDFRYYRLGRFLEVSLRMRTGRSQGL